MAYDPSYNHGRAEYNSWMQIADLEVQSLTAMEGGENLPFEQRKYAQLVWAVNAESGGASGNLTNAQLRASPIDTLLIGKDSTSANHYISTDTSGQILNIPQTYTTDFIPRYEISPGGYQSLTSDPDGNLNIRGNVTTDERSFRCNFSGSGLLLSIGNCVFTNGSTVVTTSGSFSNYDVHVGNYIKADGDAESYLEQIESMTDNEIILAEPYGKDSSGPASAAQVKFVTPVGGTISINNGNALITMGNNTGSIAELERDVDILPMVYQTGFTLNQRVDNQTIYAGVYDERDANNPYYYCWFKFTGTDNTQVLCESAFSRNATPVGAEIESTQVPLPDGQTTILSNRYRIELTGFEVNFYINDKLVARHTKSMPRPVDLLTATLRVVNGTLPTTGTQLNVDYLTVNNHDFFMVGYSSQSAKVLADLPDEIKVNTVALTTSGVLFTQDVGKAPFVDVNILNAGISTIVFENSNTNASDSTGWQPIVMTNSNDTSTPGSIYTTTTGHFYGFIPGKYFRAKVTSYQSGTVSANMIARANGVVTKTAGYDSVQGKMLVGNTKDLFRDPFSSKDSSKWIYPTESGTQYTRSRVDGNVAGASYLVVDLNALSAGGDDWQMVSQTSFKPPYEIEHGLQISQRLNGQDFSVEMVGVDASGSVISTPSFPPVQILTSITIASSAATVTTVTPHNLLPGDFVYLYGCLDPRLNYGPVAVTSISASLSATNQFVMPLPVMGAGTFPVGLSGYVQRVCATGLAQYQAGNRWYGTTAGNNDAVSTNNDPRPRVVNWNVGNTQDAQTVIGAEGGPTYTSLNYVQALRTKGTWHFEHTTKRLVWRSRDIDSTSADRSTTYRRIPNPDHTLNYKIRIRARNYNNMSVPSYITTAIKKGNIIATLNAPTGGSLYTNGVYKHIPVTGGTGVGATLNITITGNVVSAVAVAFAGYGYTASDTLTCANTLIGGTGSGWQVTVATVTASSANTVLTVPNHGLQIGDGCLSVLGAITAGSGYIDGVYTNVPLTGGTGQGATARIQVSAGAVISVIIMNPGKNYTAADSLSCSNTYLGGSGSSFAVAVTTIIASTDYIVVYGVRDATNFANLTTATILGAVLDSNTIGISFGAAVSNVLTTSYGGFIMKVNGSIIPNIQTMQIQSYQKTLDGLRLSIVGSATWTETIGDSVTLYGLTDSTPTPQTALWGRYRVAYISTNTMELEPLDGQSLSGVITNATNAGGGIIRNTSLRIDYFRLFDRIRNEIDLSNSGSTLQGDGLAVNVTNSVTVTATNLSCNMNQWAGSTPLSTSPNGATNKAVVANLAGPVTFTDYSAQDWKAISGSGSTISNTNGTGASVGFDVNATAWTAGSSLGTDVYLQESMDDGTTWFDIWQCETITGISHIKIPGLPIYGRRRMRWVNRGGAATTVTMTVKAMDCSIPAIRQVQWFDRTTSGITTGVLSSNTYTSAFDIASCKNVLAILNLSGASTSGTTFQAQMSIDSLNWYPASPIITKMHTSAEVVPIPICAGFVGKYMRVGCLSAASGQVMNYIGIYGTN